MKLALALGLALLSPIGARAQAPTDPAEDTFRAMTDEMRRTASRLEMNRLGKPYFVGFTVLDSYRLEVEGSFGALRDPNMSHTREIKASLRVGDHRFDQSHYVGRDYWRYRPFTDEAPFEPDYDALRYNLWQLADAAYKYSLEKFSQKKAYQLSRSMEDDKLNDFSEEEVHSSRTPVPIEPFNPEPWHDTVRKVSGVFKAFPEIQSSGASLYWTQRQQYYVDNEGRRTLKPANDYEFSIQASAQAGDGLSVSDKRRFIRQSLADMPGTSDLEAEAARTARDVSALTKAPAMETYIGPVLLEGQASAEFFNQLLAHNLSFGRAPWIEDERLKENYASGELAERLGQRVISPLISVTDDPSMPSFSGQPLIGRYAIDDEGIPSRKIPLIAKGILKDVLMSRAPIKERSHSNGHGRGNFTEFPSARISSLIIKAEKSLTHKAMKEELLQRARDYGLPYGIVIRRLGEEDAQEKDEILAAPILVYRVYVIGGREELVRNARFSGVTLRALRDIVAASDKDYVYNYYQLGPDKSNRGQLQASIVCPSILVAEMELKKTEKKPERRPYLTHPYFSKR